jgi:3-deoxy-D-manno-octulosonic-acid transferase
MRWLYNIGIHVYYLLICISSLRNKKAQKWISGRRNIFKRLQEQIVPGEPLLWFHASSLGEFEQGRPVIEAIRKNSPGYKILLTFFSPSGYELRKNYPNADYVFYLPLDTRKNAARFLDIVKPEKVFFIKYEFWFNFLTELRERQIPTYIFSALFRPSQIFFKPWGKWFRKALLTFDKIFVQNQESFSILNKYGFNNVQICGDTRLDAVGGIADAAPRLEKMEQFCGNQKPVIAGSTWKEDEELFIRFVNENNTGHKFVIAPHEVNEQSIERITGALNKSYVLYSKASKEELSQSDVLIVDGYGYLVSLYRYSIFAYVGGGFTDGIHSILEPAAFGLPVIFGPDYRKFQEAHDLLKLGAANTVSDYTKLAAVFNEYLANSKTPNAASKTALNYVNKNRGASEQIVNNLFKQNTPLTII